MKATYNLPELFKAARPQTKDITRNSYYYQLRKIAPEKEQKKLGMGVSTNPVSLEWIKDAKATIKRIKLITVNTQRAALSPILIIVKHLEWGTDLYDQYNSHLQNLTAARNALEAKHVKTDTQEKNWISSDELREYVTKLTPRGGTILQRELWRRYMIVGKLYVLQPPVRHDYNAMLLATDGDELDRNENYLVFDPTIDKPAYFSFGKYKTATEESDPVKVKCRVKMADELLCWLGERRTGYMLEDAGEPLSKSQLGFALSKCFAGIGKHITSNLIRHIVCSEAVDISHSVKLSHLQNDMMHGAALQLKYAKE